MKKEDVTLAITSCGRMDLLEKTLRSFFEFNTYPIFKTIIIDDSGGGFDLTRIELITKGRVEFLINDKNIGQIKSIDRLYASITTEYIFHCEDDWEFYQPGFIEESIELLRDNPEIITVWLRAHDDTNGHPLTKSQLLKGGCERRFMARRYRGVWSGFTFNPGLRRLRDYKLVAPFSEKTILVHAKNKTIVSEVDLSLMYDSMGYKAVISRREGGYVRHIGFANHIPQEWEKSLLNRMVIYFKNLIKTLLL